ncbi:unnamed protein product [Urochloa humidicola]
MVLSCCVAAYLDMLDGSSSDEFDDSTCSSLEYTGNYMSSAIGRAVDPLLPIREKSREASLPRHLRTSIGVSLWALLLVLEVNCWTALKDQFFESVSSKCKINMLYKETFGARALLLVLSEALC